MKRPGAILIPLLGGFLLTVATVSWRSGWWPLTATPESAATSWHVAVRRPNLRVVPVELRAGFPATLPAAPTAPVHALPAPSAPVTPQAAADYVPPPVPRADPGNSPERLDASARKFAHGSRADED